MDQILEQWRSVKGYEGLYEVSDLGRVRSLDRIIRSNGRVHRITGRVLVLCGDKDGYPKIKLSKNGRITMKFVHRLVADAFLPPPPGPVGQATSLHYNVDHINEIPCDNRADNLQWITRHENTCIKPRNRGNLGKARGSRQGSSKLSEDAVLQIRSSSASLGELARRYKVSKQTICKVKLRQSWKHV